MTAVATSTSVDDLADLPAESQVVLINHLSVPSDEHERFLEAWAADEARLRDAAGFVEARLRTGVGGAFTSIVVWDSAQALRAALHAPELRGLTALDPSSFAETHELDHTYRFGTVEIDAMAREVHKNGAVVRLTLKEYELLVALVSRPRRVFSRDELMDRVWGYRATLETGTLTVHVRRLREKLEDDPAAPRYLQTVWGVGYRFVP